VAIDFRDAVMAQITQAVLAALLERCGYRITRLGIEELCREVKYKDLAQYRQLALPERLRCLPDLLVVSPGGNRTFLVEVKYRRCFDDASARRLFKAIHRQRKHWPEAYAVLMISQPFGSHDRFHQDYIRVLPPNATDRLTDRFLPPQERWRRLPRLQYVFKALSDSRANRALADLVTHALKSLDGL
jgi:hypothetical protein